MQTQYRLLYRYLNESTNTPVTNESEYIKTEEFYNDGHRLGLDKDKLNSLYSKGFYFKYMYDGGFLQRDGDFSQQNALAEAFIGENQNEAESERENLIVENMSNDKKSNNLYVYTGTKKTYKKQYIPEQLGYVVRDFTMVPKEQIPDSPEDFSKHFVMVGGSKLGFDGAYLICKPQYIDVYKKKQNSLERDRKCFLCISAMDKENKGYSRNTDYYNKETYINNINSVINREMFFKWYDRNDESIEAKYGEIAVSCSSVVNYTIANGAQSGVKYLQTSKHTRGSSSAAQVSHYLFIDNTLGKDYFNLTEESFYDNSYDIEGYKEETLLDNGYYYYGQYIEINEDNIIKDIIPAHYEDTGESPYYIKDTYQKINLSPWIQHSVHNSLESALTSARKLVSMIGIDNVKLIKYVPFDQFINIK